MDKDCEKAFGGWAGFGLPNFGKDESENASPNNVIKKSNGVGPYGTFAKIK